MKTFLCYVVGHLHDLTELKQKASLTVDLNKLYLECKRAQTEMRVVSERDDFGTLVVRTCTSLSIPVSISKEELVLKEGDFLLLHLLNGSEQINEVADTLRDRFDVSPVIRTFSVPHVIKELPTSIPKTPKLPPRANDYVNFQHKDFVEYAPKGEFLPEKPEILEFQHDIKG